MIVEVKSILTGNLNRMQIPSITRAEWEHWKKTGGLVERAFPHCTTDQHEFLRSGVTPQERELFNHLDM